MQDFRTVDIEVSGKHLFVISVNLEKKGTMHDVSTIIRPIFMEIALFLKKTNHVMYIRDIKKYSIDGKYIQGDTYVENEIKLAIPAWPVDGKDLLGSAAHELHHLARWQTVGYGKTLGEALITEGCAQRYAFEKSGKLGLWTLVDVTDALLEKAFAQWNDAAYNHREWFYQGPLGRWIGYAIGYKLTEKIFEDGFDLKKSLYATAADVRKK